MTAKLEQSIQTMSAEVITLLHNLDHTLDQFLEAYKKLRQQTQSQKARGLNESARLLLELTALHGLWYSSLKPWLDGSVSSAYTKWPADPKQE